MAQTITQSAAGASASVQLENGYFAAFVSAAGWGEVVIQVSDDGIDWYDAELYSGGVVISANKAIRLLGGLYYRLNVLDYDSPVTMKVVPTIRTQIVPYQVTLPACG